MLLVLVSCSQQHNNEQNSDGGNSDFSKKTGGESSSFASSQEEASYEDGDYCATIDYYNPNTGTSSTYELPIEVEGNELTVIHWPNGGWLDHSHFCCAEFDDNGQTSFTSDQGYQYDVTITGTGGCGYNSGFNPENEVDGDEEVEAQNEDGQYDDIQDDNEEPADDY